MSKFKKSECKKSFVRNTEQSISKTVVKLDGKAEETIKIEPEKRPERKSEPKTRFNSPKVQSTLGITKQIASLENIKPRKIKSLSDIDRKQKLAVDEKLTRRVNFPNDQAIYKDLIPLCVKSQPAIAQVSRDPLPLKDREPNLNDFFKPKVLPEYSFEVPAISGNKSMFRQHDGLNLYKIMRNWE